MDDGHDIRHVEVVLLPSHGIDHGGGLKPIPGIHDSSRIPDQTFSIKRKRWDHVPPSPVSQRLRPYALSHVAT